MQSSKLIPYTALATMWRVLHFALASPLFSRGLGYFAILSGAMLVAMQFTSQSAGQSAPTELLTPAFYGAVLYAPLAAAATFGLLISLVMSRVTALAAQLLGFIASVLFTVGVGWFLLPMVPPFQWLIFTLTGALLSLTLLVLPAYVLAARPQPPMIRSLAGLWISRSLLRLWVTNNVRARYSQAVLGVLWIIVLPLSQAVILSFVFVYVLRFGVTDVPFISFFLSALVPWSFFSMGLINASGAVVAQMGLINQVYFPREILVLVRLGELIVDTLFTFLALLIINLLSGILPNVNFVFLPLLFAILLLLTLGLMLIVSCITVFIRDIPQLLSVILQLLFYLTPIIFPLSFLPQRFIGVALLNPMSSLVTAFRDVIVYNKPPDLLSLHYPLVVGCAALWLGYRIFKAYEARFADFV